MKIKLTDESQFDALLDEDAYKKILWTKLLNATTTDEIAIDREPDI